MYNNEDFKEKVTKLYRDIVKLIDGSFEKVYKAESKNDEATLELLYSEIKRLDLCNTLLLYDYISD